MGRGLVGVPAALGDQPNSCPRLCRCSSPYNRGSPPRGKHVLMEHCENDPRSSGNRQGRISWRGLRIFCGSGKASGLSFVRKSEPRVDVCHVCCLELRRAEVRKLPKLKL